MKNKLQMLLDEVIKKEKQEEWMNTSLESLDGKSPNETIKEGNKNKVIRILTMISQGIFS